ncbi:MAG: imidazole glycerol phosphate synthase subunit HisH [Lachnospiraceae bacterium]|nr:imidazole glycerol phosphate synthase subunit HisH [Lachnospiraceae bacterium]
MIGIIDYGAGNLRSVQKALEYLGFEAVISDSQEILNAADKIILPGVGAFSDAMDTIKNKRLDIVIKNAVKSKKPFLGICLGMQILFDKGYENGSMDGLGIFPGEIVKLDGKLKIPHMGWNKLDVIKKEPLFIGIPEEAYVYFVHSYYLETKEPGIVSATCFYGKDISIAVQSENTFGLQFHPEKSGETGLKILKNFGGLK